MKSKLSIILSLFLLLGGCKRVSDQVEPQIDYAVQDRYIQLLSPPFPPLSPEEMQQPWGIEYQIGQAFAHQLELYQAITAFKRAEVLLPDSRSERKLEVIYGILFCYYLGKKYGDVTYTFERSPLRYVDKNFTAYHDLLLILYESYLQQSDTTKANQIREVIRASYPETAERLGVTAALMQGEVKALPTLTTQEPLATDLNTFVTQYEMEKKSVKTAQSLNALIPGAGYFYLGQGQSGLTALLLNGLFIAAAVYSFQHRNIAAGAIFTSFEAGWYFGGIYGAGLEAKYYNERVYERLATPLMHQNRLFPVLMIHYAF